MALSGLFTALQSAGAYERLLRGVRDGPQRVTVPDAARPLVLGALWHSLRAPMAVICPRPEDARRLVDALQSYGGADSPIYHFGESDALAYERLSLEEGTIHERLAALSALRNPLTPGSSPPGRAGVGPGQDRARSQEGRSGEPARALIVTSVAGVLQKTISPQLLAGLTRTIRRGDKLSVEALLEAWARMGYAFVPTVEAPGSMSRRGGIVDVYPTAAAQPARIELWGDYVDSIRLFDPRSQRSLGEVDEVVVGPAAEILPHQADAGRVDAAVRALDFSRCKTSERDRIQDELAELMAGLSRDNGSFYAGFLLEHTLLDHLRLADGAVTVVCEPGEVEEAARQFEAAAEKMREVKQARGELPERFPSWLADWRDVWRQLSSWPRHLQLSRFHVPHDETPLPLTTPPTYQSDFDALATAIDDGDLGAVVFVSQHAKRVAELLAEADLGGAEVASIDEPVGARSLHVVHGAVAGGWTLREGVAADSPALVTLLSDVELFGSTKRRVIRPRRKSAASLPSSFHSVDELSIGQFVVHIDHGIGRFAGTTAMPAPGPDASPVDAREYLVLEYAEHDKIYVPMEHLARLAPYLSGDDAPPTLTRLGTQEWSRSVARAKETTKKLAVDLLKLYAKRQAAEGFPHSPDTPWQREMEDAFPYEETPDQAVAIEQVKAALEEPKPMDWLVCGDVGYGKTEVALRAAFKCVMSGRQAAVLVPTTVLAQQHYVTFAERFSPYPIRVEVLSRFRTDKEQDEVIAGLKSGEVDVVIGTHRLVQKDVGFKDLGLVVIDEEHRFGVGHKERLKEMRAEVDVLALTATPIPRTLHMALAGIRDMSAIETPPEDRLPIKTYLAEYSEDLIREAILRELDRGGQVFFLHNRVKSIDLTVAQLQELVPEARFAVAHGQMPEEQLAEVMADFAEGAADVLACTTIIESGLDIPTVNTLIVDRADRLGLAQLYQLRGRIGRRDQRAYAYLLVQRGRRLSEAAQHRLQTIAAATELGAGFRIAMKDLEIRGAGNLLGPEQSGHIQAIGFELFSRLLAEAVQEAKAEGKRQDGRRDAPEPQIDLGVAAAIPESIVPHMPTRMALYQRLAKADSTDEVTALASEFRDRFGHRLPDSVYHLLFAVRVRVLAQMARVEAVTMQRTDVMLKLVDEVGGARLPLQATLGHGARVGNQQIHVPLNGDAPWGQALTEVLERMIDFQARIPEMMAALRIED